LNTSFSMILLIKRAELNKLLYCKKQLKCD
jgi:hypothetical protein